MVKVRDFNIWGPNVDEHNFVKVILELDAYNSICKTVNCFPSSRRNAITWPNEFRLGKISPAEVLLGMYSVCSVSKGR